MCNSLLFFLFGNIFYVLNIIWVILISTIDLLIRGLILMSSTYLLICCLAGYFGEDYQLWWANRTEWP